MANGLRPVVNMGSVPIIVSIIMIWCLSDTVFGQNETELDLGKLSRSNAFFADRLYKQLSTSPKNLVFSPLSISIALSMLSFGAGGKSFEELNSTLGFPFAQLNEHELLDGYQNLVTSLTEPAEGHRFDLANAEFVQDSFPINPNYTDILVDNFHAEVRQVDFGRSEETLATINGWVKNNTAGKIESILEEVSSQDAMALLNAVYFKGNWRYQFDEERTQDNAFFTENGTRKSVKMMTNLIEVNFKFKHEVGGSVLELPYKDNVFSLVLVLPNRESNLTELANTMTPEALLRISESLTLQNVTVGIPKIKLESSVDLKIHLPEIGVRDIFGPGADLSRISPIPLYVSQAKHKATIELNEEGAEASAVTVIVTTTRTGPTRPHFWANRPFLFILRHNPTNTICFMGKVVDV